MTPFTIAGHHLDLSRIVCIGAFRPEFGKTSARCDVTFEAIETTIHGLTFQEWSALVVAWRGAGAISGPESNPHG